MRRKSDAAQRQGEGVKTDWIIILLVWAAGLGAAAQFGKVAIALEAFREIYDVSEVALGFLISCVGLAGLILGVLGGIISPRIGIRRMFISGMFAAAVLSALQSMPLPFGVLILLRSVEGASHLFIVIAGPILMARHSSIAARGAVMTLWSSFFGLSYMIVALIAPWIIGRFGVNGLFLAHAAYMLLLALLLTRSLPMPRQTNAAEPNVEHLTMIKAVKLHLDIYRSPWLSAAALGFVFYTGLYIALLTYLPDFVAPAFRVGLSASLPFASIVTSLTVGVLLLRYVSPVRAVVIGYVLTALCAIPLVFVVNSDPLFVLFSIVLLAATGIVPGASFAALAELNTSDKDRAYATGAIAQLGNLGTTCGPPILAVIVAVAGIAGTVGFILMFCLLGIVVHAVLARKRTLAVTQID